MESENVSPNRYEAKKIFILPYFLQCVTDKASGDQYRAH
jgi:hypothetical protein